MIDTDFTTHHIEGIAREGNTPFRVPLKLRESRCSAVLCNKVFEGWLLKQKPGRSK